MHVNCTYLIWCSSTTGLLLFFLQLRYELILLFFARPESPTDIFMCFLLFGHRQHSNRNTCTHRERENGGDYKNARNVQMCILSWNFLMLSLWYTQSKSKKQEKIPAKTQLKLAPTRRMAMTWFTTEVEVGRCNACHKLSVVQWKMCSTVRVLYSMRFMCRLFCTHCKGINSRRRRRKKRRRIETWCKTRSSWSIKRCRKKTRHNDVEMRWLNVWVTHRPSQAQSKGSYLENYIAQDLRNGMPMPENPGNKLQNLNANGVNEM